MGKWMIFSQCCMLVLLSLNSADPLETISSEKRPSVMSSTKLPSSEAKTYGDFLKRLSHELIPVTRELLHHLKWKRISLVVEDLPMYRRIADSIKKELKDDVTYVAYTYNTDSYVVEDHSASLLQTMKEATNESRIVILLSGIRMAKECLIAAYDLKLTLGNNVFVAFELDAISAAARQAKPFKWITAEYAHGTFKEYLANSAKLCWALESTLVITTKLPVSTITEIAIFFQRKHLSSSPLDKYESITLGYQMFVSEKGEYRFPLSVYHYGGQGAGRRCVATMHRQYILNIDGRYAGKRTYPEMVAIADIKQLEQNNEWKLSFNPLEKSQLYWPGNESIYNVRDELQTTMIDGKTAD